MTPRSDYFWTAEGFLIDDLFRAIEGEGPVYADPHLVVTRTEHPLGVRFAGEIDVTNSDAVGQVIRLALPESDHPHLDLSGLSFCDVSGIRALVEAARDLGEGGRLMLHGLPLQLQTVMRVTGWSKLPSLTLCACVG
jgi:anti-anti-sigma factor